MFIKKEETPDVVIKTEITSKGEIKLYMDNILVLSIYPEGIVHRHFIVEFESRMLKRKGIQLMQEGEIYRLADLITSKGV